jgi:predicted DsbA family dithiol-disulfide isomerase
MPRIVNSTFNGNISSTTNYHRLLHHAYALGGQSLQLPLVDRLNHGYFEKAKDVGDIQWLAEEAVNVGVFKTQQEGVEWLSGQEGLEEVRMGYKRASVSPFALSTSPCESADKQNPSPSGR